MPVAKTFTSFSCQASSAPSSGTTTFRLRINGVNTSNACTFSSGDGNTVSGTYTVAAGDTVDVQVSNSSSNSSRAFAWGLGG
jgi:hypothetical protein